MKKIFFAFVLFTLCGIPAFQVSAISPQEINTILEKKRSPYLQGILKAHDRAIEKRSNAQTTEIEIGLWRTTQSMEEASIRTRPSYTSDSFRMKAIRTPEMLQQTNRKRTGITRRSIEQPQLWSRTRAQDKELRIRKFSKGGDAFKRNIGTPKTSISEQKTSYLKQKRYEYNPLDSQ